MCLESLIGTLIGYVHRRTQFFQMAFQTTCTVSLNSMAWKNVVCLEHLIPFKSDFAFFLVLVTFSLTFHLHYITGLPVTEEQLKEAATQSGVLTVPDDFLPPEFRAECERVLPDSETIRPHECRDAYIYLKDNFQL